MATMRTVEEHARVIAALLGPTPAALIPLAAADGLVLADDLVANIDLPPFANSAMDGYAVRSVDVANLPVTLPVSQDIPAGRTDTAPLAAGTAARIMTGAPYLTARTSSSRSSAPTAAPRGYASTAHPRPGCT